MNGMNSYDYRQLKIMKQKIKAYRSGELDLCSLIGDLEGLLNALQDKDEVWKKKFRANWAALEEVYAVALADERSFFDSEDEVIINNALENLSHMILDAIQAYSDMESEGLE